MNKEFEVYLIDDDSIEVLKLGRVFKTLGLSFDLVHFNNGNEAIKKLSDSKDVPKIILLDLNMSKFSGLDFLKAIKHNEGLKKIPVIVLTTSNNRKDIIECYNLGAAGYIVKPLKYEDYLERIKRLCEYWSINEMA